VGYDDGAAPIRYLPAPRPIVTGSTRLPFWLLLAACVATAALILLLTPSERTIGQVIKIVYLHGALSRAGMIGFIAAGATGAAYLVSRNPALERWSWALLLSGWGFWTAHFLVSMPATRLTWGPWIAWGEPRVTMTLQIIAAGLVMILVSVLVRDPRVTALAGIGIGLVTLVMAGRTGVIRHPLDPIGSSPSATLRLVYLLLLVPLIAAMFLIAGRLAARSRT